MAGHARYTALLDACVLFPLAMVDSLMSLAEAGLYAAKWSTRIEEEWIRALETKRPDLKGRLGTRRDAMREAVPDWEVPETAWKAVVGSVQLPDPDDAHVLAAAIAAHAEWIGWCHELADRVENVGDRVVVGACSPAASPGRQGAARAICCWRADPAAGRRHA